MDEAREAVQNGPALDERWNSALGGRFELVHMIDGSGRASIVHAQYLELARPVVLRIAPWPTSPSTEGATFIEEEARALAQLHHPAIPHIYDFGHSGGFSWIAMEHVEFPSLESLMPAGPLSLRAGIELALELGTVLAFANEQGYLHGNLTPRKVFSHPAGRAVKILGFSGERILPRTPANELRHGVDVRALAGILMTVTGWPAVVDLTSGVPLPDHLRDILRPEQTRWFDNILRKARQSDPHASLYGSMKELCEDLEVFHEFAPDEVGHPSPVVPAPVPPRAGSSDRSPPGINLLEKQSRRSGSGGDDLDLAPIVVRIACTAFPTGAAVAACYLLHEDVSIPRTLLVLGLLVCCLLLVVDIWSEDES